MGPDLPRRNETGGSAPGASSPSSIRGPRHTSPPPGACIPSRSDDTGTRREETETETAYKAAKRRSGIVATEKKLLYLSNQVGERRIHRRPAGIEYNLPLRTQQLKPLAHSLADTPLDTISNRSPAQRPRHRKPDFRAAPGMPRPLTSALRIRCAQAKGREERTGVSGAVVIHSPEVFGA